MQRGHVMQGCHAMGDHWGAASGKKHTKVKHTQVRGTPALVIS